MKLRLSILNSCDTNSILTTEKRVHWDPMKSAGLS